MPQAPLLHRAKQGDAAAIAALINRHATSLGVVAHVNVQQPCLYIILEGQEPPPQLFWSHYLKRSLHRLGATAITQLCIYGRVHGSKRSAWRETIDLSTVSPTNAPAPPFQGVNMTAAPGGAYLPDSVPSTERYRLSNGPSGNRPSGNRPSGSAGRHKERRSPPQRGASLGPKAPAWLSWPSIRRGYSQINFALATRWFVSTALVGIGAVALYYWSRSADPLIATISRLPQTELLLACTGIFGWLLGWAQSTLLKDWVTSSEQWIPTVIVGAIGAQLCLMTVPAGGLYLALCLAGLVPWLTLRRWVNRGYLWITIHLTAAIAAAVTIPVMAAIITTFEWGRGLAFDLNVDYGSAVNISLLWLIYSASSALAMGKLFYCPRSL